jgi:hypothetical protein
MGLSIEHQLELALYNVQLKEEDLRKLSNVYGENCLSLHAANRRIIALRESLSKAEAQIIKMKEARRRERECDLLRKGEKK